MPRYSYVNGSYIPHYKASVHIEDRGYQFADGVYEVISCINGNIADEQGHLDRLERSLNEISMTMPVSRVCLQHLIREVLRRNRINNGYVYIQVTRGVAKRDFHFPNDETRQSLIISSRPYNFEADQKISKGIKVVITKDNRWKRPDIKSISLLPQVLAKQEAVGKGAYEAWLIDDKGFITEGASSNAWILTYKDVLVTAKASGQILKGVTRTSLYKILNELGLCLEERSFTAEEAYEAKEAFSSSATALIMPVIEIDGYKIGTGKPGPLSKRLYDEYLSYVAGLRGDYVSWVA